MPPLQDKQKKGFNNYVRYTGLGFQMLAVIGLGVWGGIALDKRLGTGSAFTITLSLISVLLGLGLVIREFLKIKK